VRSSVLSASLEPNLARAADVLRRGGLVAFPTDTVYGLAALAFDEQAVRKIYEVKGRPNDKAIPVLLASAAEIDIVAREVGARVYRLAAQFWPGPLTLVVPKSPQLPESVASATVGIRVPDHPVALALLGLTGPLAVTSANLSGAADPVNADQVLQQLGGGVDLILDGGITPGGIPSTVVDCTGEELVIVRPGPLDLDRLQAALH
jgi:L-threonylcarbamoyladenylate synthase